MKQQVLFFFFTLMLTGISVSAHTGGGRIAGVVIDNAGEEPLPGATIFIEELKKGIVTDGHGRRCAYPETKEIRTGVQRLSEITGKGI